MNAKPVISLIFVNYRSVRYLAKALESLFSFERDRDLFEVIVVNNDTSESKDLAILRQSFPFLLLESGSNTGFGSGNNRGAGSARGNILGFINPDVLWTGTYLRSIQHLFFQEKKIGVLGMALLTEDNHPEVWSVGMAPSIFRLVQNNLFPSSQAFWKKAGLSFPDWVSGGALFIRTEIFSEIGGFDERFFLYFEDVDLCSAVRKRGFSVAYNPTFSLIHLGGKSKHSQALQKQHFYASQRKYFDKRRPGWESKLLSVLHIFFRTR
jgi:hypothetical protein